MSKDRMRILAMVAEGKISAQEADTLLDALGADGEEAATTQTAPASSAD